jgi:hypothetical protein
MVGARLLPDREVMLTEADMQRRKFIGLVLGCGIVALGAPALAAVPESWDGLVRVKAKKLAVVYLQPGADFSGYRRVMIDPTEVSFEKNWARNYNRGSRGLSGKVSDADVEKSVQQGAAAATDIFADAFTKAGYPNAKEAGPDVLRVRTMILNVSVTSPDIQTAGRQTSYASEAGQASLVVELRDSETGALLARGVDRKLAGANFTTMRNQVTNRADFNNLVRSWADTSAKGVAELKSLPRVEAASAK